jgi:phenylalanyl-tRNA synthetase beta chain
LRAPLSWLRDFAPFAGEPAGLAAVLDDLGLVVEGIETVGEGLGDVIVARVTGISSIEGADRIRSVVVDAGAGPVDVVCGAWNFDVGDLVALAPVGSVLPGGFAIKARRMKGAPSNGMLCSGRELNLSDDHEGILRLNDVDGAAVGRHLTDVLGIEPDAIFDIAVEANRPDAWCMAGVARDLAARTGVPFSTPDLEAIAGGAVPPGAVPHGAEDAPVEALASVRVDDLELCPRFTARVITGVTVGPSPRWLARRLTMAGMRPINNVVDASNYVMLELGQPTHPYDLDRLAGDGLIVRRAEPGETLTTLDGTVRTLGRPGPGSGDTGEDCLICDAQGVPVGIGGVMGGASSEIDATSTRVLLEAAYFVPMAIARTSKRLGLRTEASARFERGCDPAGIDRAAERFCELLALTAGPGMEVAKGVIDIRGDVPGPVTMIVRTSRINALLGSDFSPDQIVGLLTPLGMQVDPDPGAAAGSGDGGPLVVTVPTFRPDIRPAPMGEADIAEEVARTYGYARIVRRAPSWPQPGRLTQYQKDRRHLKDVLCGLGASEAWTQTFVSESDQLASGEAPPYIEVTNPLVESERFLRSSMMPGLIRAIDYNTERRQGSVRLFELGSVFHHLGRPPAGGEHEGDRSDSSERLSAIFAQADDDAWTMAAAWQTIAEALGLAAWHLGDPVGPGTADRILHPYRSATISGLVAAGSADGGTGAEGSGGSQTVVGVLGELDPSVVGSFGLLGTDGRPRRIGWLDLEVGILLDRGRVPRRSEEARPVSRYPSSDIDLSFVVPDGVRAGSVQRTLRAAGGALLESIELFAVYRGASVEDGARSLTFRLRFCAQDRTLTDEELGRLRRACIDAVVGSYPATLR